MRVASPTSRTRFRFRLVLFDGLWALAAPFLAFALRDPQLLDPGGLPSEMPETYRYALVAVPCALSACVLFRLGDRMYRFFTLHDALVICSAVACAAAASSAILFSFTRLEGVPRSTPLLFALVLGSGLICARAAVRTFFKEVFTARKPCGGAGLDARLRRVILIGVDRFAAAAIKLTDAQTPRTTQVAAMLDLRAATIGRKIAGVDVVGQVADLAAVIDEYAIHGVDIDEIWLANEATLSSETRASIAAQCASRGLKLQPLSEALNLVARSAAPLGEPAAVLRDLVDLNAYFALKRTLDILAAAALLIALSPIGFLVAAAALYDVGAPVLFWQQRLGKGGCRFLLYKFRTFHAPFDRNGRRVAEERRLTAVGRALRASRLDEIPQLYNVLVGDMSLIGPRPLLPQDQPRDPRLRLLVRPGVSGWAQINGGTSISPEEKEALDVWYIWHASFWLDLKIAVLTLWVAVAGEQENPAALAQALRWRRQYFGERGVTDAGEKFVGELPGDAWRAPVDTPPGVLATR